ncbi:MAG: LPS-assembly protein LptD [Deltaproteobacteria bacterium]|nr:LPS-assembly protein LptD [Deltaproteobacteria bacterium]
MILASLLAVTATGTSTGAISKALGEVPFILTADRLAFDRREIRAEGGVELRRLGLELTAEKLVIDRESNRVTIESATRIREGGAIATCRHLELELPELLGVLRETSLVVRDVSSGRRELTMEADEVERVGARRYSIDGGSFTPCDCEGSGGSRPVWRIGAASADVDLDSGVALSWPVFFLYDVPVFALPAFYVPLGDRRSGLLAPRIRSGSVTGLFLSEPLYLTLGTSADLTLEPGVMLSRGPALGFELRWADERSRVAAIRARGLLDHGTRDADGLWSWSREDGLPRSFLSGGIERSVAGSHVGFELALPGDSAWVGELTDGYALRQAQLSATRLTVVRPGLVRTAASLSLLADSRSFRYPLEPGEELREVSPFSARRPGPGDAPQRLFEVRLDALPYSLVGMSADSASLAILGSARMVATAYVAPAPGAPRFVRADFRPELTLPVSLLGVLSFAPTVALRMTGWSGRLERESASAGRIGLVQRNEAFTEVFDGDSARPTRIRLALGHLLIPFVEGSMDLDECKPIEGASRCPPTQTFNREDELDTLSPVHQLLARLSIDTLDQGGQRLWFASLGVARDLDFRGRPGAGTSPLTARAGARFAAGPVSVSLRGALGLIVSGEDPVELADADLELSFGGVGSVGLGLAKRGDRVPSAHLVAPEEIAPSHTFRDGYVGADEFRSALLVGDLSLERWVRSFGGTIRGSVAPWSWLQLSGAALLDLEALASETPTALEETFGPKVRNLVGSIRLAPPCDCLELGVTVDLARDREGPDFGFVLDLARLGEVRG